MAAHEIYTGIEPGFPTPLRRAIKKFLDERVQFRRVLQSRKTATPGYGDFSTLFRHDNRERIAALCQPQGSSMPRATFADFGPLGRQWQMHTESIHLCATDDDRTVVPRGPGVKQTAKKGFAHPPAQVVAPI